MVVDIDDDPDLRDTASGGHVASNDGSDLGFRNGSGVALGFEVIEFDAASGSLLAWVHTPPLSAQADMTVYLHYGDPDAIFDGGGPWSDYLAVYHFEDDLSAATIRDSGPNGADGTHSGLGPGDTTAGMVGSGIDFGVADGGIVVDDAALDVPGPLAISAWGKMEGDTVAGFQRIYQHASPGVRYAELYVEDSVLTLGQVNVRANYLDPTTYAEIESVPGSFSMNTWHHYVAVFDNDGGELRLFFDGQLQATVPWTPPLSTGSTTTYLGNWGFQADSREWVGDLDEIHVRAFAPDVAWAGASFDNQNDPGGFYVVGPEETP
jgi:hypothetical protein